MRARNSLFALLAAFGDAAGLDAVVHRLAQRAVRLGQALGALDHLGFGQLMLPREFLFACLDLREHAVVAMHERADFVVRVDIGAPRVVAALGGLHRRDEIQ
jgi:hypothetical protein